MEKAVDRIFRPLIVEIDKVIEFCNNKGGMGGYTPKVALMLYKSKVIEEKNNVRFKLIQIHDNMKSTYNS